jgi:3-hydroxyacyl-[acyl-carrier-protein] dehydratase
MLRTRRLALRFVLIDKLLELAPGKHATASMAFPHTHDVFADHFPGKPVVPGVLLTEAMGQTAGWLIAATIGFDRWPLLVMIEQAKFRRLVAPDEDLRITAHLRSARDDTFAVDAGTTSGGDRVATARLIFHAFTFSLADAERDRFAQWAKHTFDHLGGPSALARREP